MGKLYTLQVLLTGGPVPQRFARQEISRTIQIRGDQTLEDLHRAIFAAFDREEEHLYEFQFGEGPTDPRGPRYAPRLVVDASPEDELAGHTENTAIDDLQLEVNRAFGYWFDFGEDWLHQIEVVSIEEAPGKGPYPKITARVGESPPQYPEFEEE